MQRRASTPCEALLLSLGASQPLTPDLGLQGSVIKTVQDSLAVAADDPKHDQAIEKIRSVTKDWVAQYRKGGNYTGRPSYG